MEKLSRVLSDFAVEPDKMTRVRGGFLLETGDGLRMLQEYRGGTAKLKSAEALQKSLREKEFFRTDLLLRTKKGELSSRDVDGTVYVLKEWFAGQECSRENRADLFAGAKLLAELHGLMDRTEFAAGTRKEKENRKPETEKNRNSETEETGEPGKENARQAEPAGSVNLEILFDKRIRELRRARNFLKKRRRKTDYESELYRCADYYISCGEEAAKRLSASNYEGLRRQAEENGTIVHGAYHYHNILILPSGAAAVNFERMAVGVQIADVYDYIRKILEKNAWNRELGYRLTEIYQRKKPMSEEEREILRILFLFPEKYWKLVNHYYNHSKTWMPGKNPEKLAALLRQEEAKKKFVEGL